MSQIACCDFGRFEPAAILDSSIIVWTEIDLSKLKTTELKVSRVNDAHSSPRESVSLYGHWQNMCHKDAFWLKWAGPAPILVGYATEKHWLKISPQEQDNAFPSFLVGLGQHVWSAH